MNLIAKFELTTGETVRIYPEDTPDWSWVDDEKTKAQINSGEIIQVIVEVLAYDKSGEVSGSDILGGVCVFSHNMSEEVEDTVEDNGMAENARDDLKRKLENIVKGMGAQ